MNLIATVAAPSAPAGRGLQMSLGTAAQIDFDLLRGHVPLLHRKLAAGRHLYRAGQAFHALFLVHAGSLKTSELAADGREQVTGFRMRGDLVGVESIGLSAYSCDVAALEHAEVWELPYHAVLAACRELPHLQARFAAAMAREIRHDRAWMLALGTLSAEQRVAAFLLDAADRHRRLGFSPHHFILRMGRADMASFLALKHETVTRALSHLDALRYVAVQRREVRVLNVDGLRVLAGQQGGARRVPDRSPMRSASGVTASGVAA